MYPWGAWARAVICMSRLLYCMDGLYNYITIPPLTKGVIVALDLSSMTNSPSNLAEGMSMGHIHSQWQIGQVLEVHLGYGVGGGLHQLIKGAESMGNMPLTQCCIVCICMGCRMGAGLTSADQRVWAVCNLRNVCAREYSGSCSLQ